MSAEDHTTSVVGIPVVVRRFFTAANGYNAKQAASCFTETAVVHDEDRKLEGRNRIFEWVAETTAKFQPTFTLLRATVAGANVKTAVAIAGRFPGSPVTLGFEFNLHGKKISTLTIV